MIHISAVMIAIFDVLNRQITVSAQFVSMKGAYDTYKQTTLLYTVTV
jgi:hypothetical protein